jgi:hypothetical protein
VSNDLGGRMHGEEDIRIAVADGGTGGLSAALVCCTVEALDTIEGTMVLSGDDQHFQVELILDAASRLSPARIHPGEHGRVGPQARHEQAGDLPTLR